MANLIKTSSIASLKFIDIEGANLTDLQFQGLYHGKVKHHEDLSLVIQRAQEVGVERMLVTGSNLEESKTCLELCKKYPSVLFSTAGVHPCHALDIEKSTNPTEYLQNVFEIAREGKSLGIVKAFGEIGLDYDRLHYAPAEIQRKYFKAQLDLAVQLDLPLFLHSRAAEQDFNSILFPYIDSGKLPRGGVVHSFTGTLQEMQSLINKGLYIGVNGCSLKTDENLEIVKHIPLEKILLETDAPWCEIRPSHSSYKLYLDPKSVDTTQQLPFESVKKEKFVEGAMVRGRCEPCAITLVAQVVAGIKGISVEQLAHQTWQNSMDLFEFNAS